MYRPDEELIPEGAMVVVHIVKKHLTELGDLLQLQLQRPKLRRRDEDQLGVVLRGNI